MIVAFHPSWYGLVHWLDKSQWLDFFVALGTLLLAAAAFAQLVEGRWSRPKLSLEGEPADQRVVSRLEGASRNVPWVRLTVANERRKRAAHGTRVLLRHFRSPLYPTQIPTTSLGQPELGWPSTEVAEGAGVVIFSGTTRPLDFGSLQASSTSATPTQLTELTQPAQLQEGEEWRFVFALAMHGRRTMILGREILKPLGGGYVAQLVVGSDEASAVYYDVTFDWNGSAPTPQQAFDSFTISIEKLTAP